MAVDSLASGAGPTLVLFLSLRMSARTGRGIQGIIASAGRILENDLDKDF